MGLTPEEKSAISDLRVEKAKEMLEDAVHNLKVGRFKTSANRSYYSAYHAARALLILKGVEPAKHEGVKAMFSLHFIKEKAVPVEMGKIYSELMLLRNEADYDDFSEVTKAEAERAVKIAKKFNDTAFKLLKKFKSELSSSTPQITLI